jgi:hypothetical protein
MRTKEQMKLYYRELGGSIVIYVAILVPSVMFGPGIHSEPWRSLVMISPMIGFCLMIWAIARQVGRADEFIRKMQMENFALASALTTGLSFTYGFLESAGYPRQSMFLVCGVMGIALFVLSTVRKTCHR